MFAIVDIAGQQFKVEQGQEVFVHRLEGEEGAQVTFDDVLLVDSDGKVTVGQPVVEGAFVSAKILSHLKGNKVLIFKKKKRKGYQKLTGHRDHLTRILIESIALTGGKPKAKKEVKEKPEASEVKEPITKGQKEVKEEAKVPVVPVPTTQKETKVKARAPKVTKPKVKKEVKEETKTAKPEEPKAEKKPVRKRAVKKAAPEEGEAVGS